MFLAFAALDLTATACNPSPSVVIHSLHQTTAVSVEIAGSPETRAQGLMYRRDLAPEAGMLFLFPEASRQSFWMKNTPLPLDMIFIGSSRTIVGVVADTKPFTTNPLGVETPSQYVLEVNAGFAAKHGLAVGDQVEFLHVPDAVTE